MMILKTSRSNLSSNDQLSLDLPFAATKSLTARVGPTPTFTRGSGATYIGSDGLIHGIDTSTTSNSISAASKTFTLAATAGQDQLWRTGDAVEASNGSNIMTGTVTSYTPSTQSLVCNMTTASGTGTFTSWRIGYRGPRFDHDPTSPFACRGLLIEEGRTNLFSSTNLNDWTAVRVTKTAITGIGLTNQATTLTISELGSTYLVRGATLTTGVAYTISVRVKAGTVASCGFGDLVDSKYSRSFNLSTNQWAASGAAAEFTNYTVTPNIDGWFLVSAIYTPTGATGVKNIAFLIYGTAVGQTASFDTPQIEAGSFPTSYIPTTTGTLARSADVCSITGGNFNGLYNQSEGTLLLNADEFRRGVSFPALLRIENSASPSANRISIGSYGTKNGNPVPLELLVTSGGTVQYSVVQTSTPSNFKAALAYKLDDVRAALNGALTAADTPPSVSPIGANTLRIGGDGIHISSVRYYRKRLPDAKLQALTV